MVSHAVDESILRIRTFVTGVLLVVTSKKGRIDLGFVVELLVDCTASR
jgi:hypothetical protein